MSMKWMPNVGTLGIAVGERAWSIAEVAPSKAQRGAWELRRVAEFAPPPPGTDPVAAGQALAEFLRQNEFTASRLVVGVPAKWVVARDKELPPADPAQA